MAILKDKLHTPIYHIPGAYKCPECGRKNKVQKAIRKHFEQYGAVGVQCNCGAVKCWYKIPDPREPKSKREGQTYYEEDEWPWREDE